MKRTLVCLLTLLFLFSTVTETEARRRRRRARPAINVSCPSSTSTINDCPDTGCGRDIDPLLNKRKNLTSDPNGQTAQKRSLSWMKNREDPDVWFKGKDRTELIGFGEGKLVKVTTFLIRIKPEGGESCNCGITGAVKTDNHLVLVEEADLDFRTFHRREEESVTAEFTPRVRIDGHPNWLESKVTPLVNAAPRKALLVRLTGLVMFDSEHFIHNPLNRITNWEIHPILAFEFCTNGHDCDADSDDGWQDLDDLP